MIKRALIKLGVHGRRHEVVRIQRELRQHARMALLQHCFWQGTHGADLNHWRMK